MAPPLLIDLSNLDLSRTVVDVEMIEKTNPQRGHMRHLDGILWMSPDFSAAVGFKDVRADEFWVPGHIPGRPLLPGVLMIEAAAQLSGFMMSQRIEKAGFLGFTGADEVKFRGQVQPGDRLLLLGREVSFKPRRFIAGVQGVVNGSLVFECKVSGMPI